MRCRLRTRFPANAMRCEEIRAEDLEEELFEGQMALPNDLLFFLDATKI